MSTAPDGRHAARGSGDGRRVWIERVLGGLLLLVLIVVVARIYLGPYLADPARFPHGIDTPGYVFRTRVVHDVGLNSLESFGERPGHAIVTSILRDVSGAGPLDWARVNPAVFAIAIGAAGGALGAAVAGERRWVAVAVGVGLAASPFVALTAIGYASNLLLDVFAVAAIALAVRVGTGRRGAAAVVLLIGAAAIAHWLFAIGLVLLLGVYATGVFVFEWTRRRSAGPRSTHPARLLVVVGLGALLGVIALRAAPELPHKVPSTKQDAAAKIATRLPYMKLAITIPLAGAGAAIMLLSGRSKSRRTAVPLAMWALAAPVGLYAWKELDMTIPHRIIPFALGVPALIVLGAAATRSWTDARASRPGGASWVVAGAVGSAVLVLASAAWLARAGVDTWADQPAGFTQPQMEQAATLAAYLHAIPPGTRVVVPVAPGIWRPLRALQVTLPIERYETVFIWRVNFLGDTRDFRRRLAEKFPGSVAAYLAGYSQQPPLKGTALGPGVTLLAGPEPPRRLSVAPIEPADAGELTRLTAISVATVLFVGLGWTLVMTGLPAFAAVGLSPAIGLAALSIGGLVAGRLGFPLGRGGGVIVALAIGALGWVAFGVGSRLRASEGESLETTSPAAVESADAGSGGRNVAGERGVRGQEGEIRLQ
jgi:hypothetical protein